MLLFLSLRSVLSGPILPQCISRDFEESDRFRKGFKTGFSQQRQKLYLNYLYKYNCKFSGLFHVYIHNSTLLFTGFFTIFVKRQHLFHLKGLSRDMDLVYDDVYG